MSLLEHSPDAPSAWSGTLPVTNRYTLGLAGERFFRAFKDKGRIYGTYCQECDVTYVPATTFCERCLNELTEWVDMGTVGELVTFTLLCVNYDGSPREIPEIVGFVRFGDGGLIHRIVVEEPEDLEIGMLLEAVFKPAAEREGSILDILGFRPAL
jgi:hypothetical protein